MTGTCIDYKGCNMTKILMKLTGSDVDQLSAKIVTHDINSRSLFNLISFTISNKTKSY